MRSGIRARGMLICAVTALTVLAASSTARAEFGLLGSWGSPGDGPALFSSPTAIATDNRGNVYVEDGNAHIQRFTRDGTFVTLWGQAGSDPGEITDAWLGLATDAAGNVYHADRGNNRITVFTSNGEFIRQFGEVGDALGQLNDPLDVDVAPNGHIFVADDDNDRVQVFTPTGEVVTAWGTAGANPGEFNGVAGIDTDTSGNVYTSDENEHRVQKWTAAGQFLTAWGSLGTGLGTFDTPEGVDIGPDGNVYVADEGNGVVQVFDPNGNFLRQFGAAEIGTPNGVAVDCRGNVYVADEQKDAVLRFGDPTTADLPFPCGLEFSAGAKPKQSAKKLKLTVECPAEACTVSIAGTAKSRDAKSKLRRKTVAVAADVPTVVRARLKKPRRADELAGGKARLAVTAVDAAAESRTEKLKVRLKRTG